MKYVRYVGLSHVRIISATDWRHVGIEGETVVWSAQNGFAVPADTLSDSQMDKAITPDPEFVVTDDEFTPAPQNRDMTPGQVVQAVENPVDVVAMANGDDDASPAISEASGGRPVVDAPVRSDAKSSGKR
jgi:hypothetical protein